MKMHPVDSSMINAIGYDQASRTLFITFGSGKTYEYADVPSEVFQDFLAADSKGQFFLAKIEDLYDYSLQKSRWR